MKHILVCSSTFPLGADDRHTARFVYDLAAALAERYDVTALAPHHPGAALAEMLGPVEVIRFKYVFPSAGERLADGTGIMANVKRSLLAAGQAPFLLGWFRRATQRLISPRRFDAVNTHWIVPAGWCSHRPGHCGFGPGSRGGSALGDGGRRHDSQSRRGARR
jgi:hypothetical protein